ncbi:MAG: hypothetical protein MJK15_03265 [Colwellia sp.]|nr:hypothetical protein [Colwellia sp.]
MSINYTDKTQAVGQTALFTTVDIILPDRIDVGLVHNFIDIVSLDGVLAPVVPSSGTYSIYVKTSEDGGFQAITDGVINATLTGGDASADGVPVTASFASNALEIKIVPDTIVGAVSYKVTIRQNLT